MLYKRLKRDIVDLIKNPLNQEGIYYIHDERNFLNGYALICGPKDTPYENGFYLFFFEFPKDYPNTPPKVCFYNRDRMFNTRFNPNLYRNGKVCLSILNTWKGEGWTSCITIRTVLITLSSILNDFPLINEPGILKLNNNVLPYNEILTYRNIDSSICDIIQIMFFENNNNLYEDFYAFKPVILELFKANYDSIMRKIEEHKDIQKAISISIYNMYCNINYVKLYEKIQNIKIELDKI